jgi:hypothetical protein
LAKKSPLFDIEPDTGVIRAASSLRNEQGKLFQLEVIAVDGGNPQQTSTGLVEIHVGGGGGFDEARPLIRFTSSSYDVSLEENAPAGRDVLQVENLCLKSFQSET